MTDTESPSLLPPFTDAEYEAAEEFVHRWHDADASEYPSPVGSMYRLMARYAIYLKPH